MRLDRYDQGGYAGGGITENGGNISGPLVLAGNPSQTLEAVPKQYVDAYFNSLNASNLTAGTLAAARLPNFTGDLQSVAGTSQLTLANSGVTPGEYGKVTVNAKGIVTSVGDISDTDIPFGLGWDKINPVTLPSTLAGYGITNAINVSGGTLTGFLSVTNQPTLGTHVTTKQYVDALVSGGGISVGDIIRKPYTTTPAGFLKCNGAEVDKTVYANLYSVIGDTFNLNTTVGSGKPWQQQYEINETQNTDLIGWSTVTALPGILAFSQAIVTKNRVYLLSGYNGSAYAATVYTAPINTDGTLGTWTTGTALPGVMGSSQAVVTKNRVYLLGGTANGTAALTTVYTAPINSDGTLGTWTTGPVLPSGIFGTSAVVIGNKFYLICGYNGSVAISTIYSTTINDDGTINSWSVYGTFPISVSSAQSAVIRNRLYIFGGASGSTVYSQVYYSDIATDGTLGSWNSGIGLPTGLHSSSIYVSKNKVYLIGGMTSMTVVTTNIYSANINSDGSLSTWEINSTLPSIYGSMPIIATKDHLFAIGGRTATNSYSSTVYSIAISGGLNDYSAYYDGTIEPVSTISTKFKLPDYSSLDKEFGEYVTSYIKF